ncbi:hypothetical protein Pyn_14232 [Prunus yedoensis var. nudiflora]|uniref:Uncharacterized protein n=1 Tax=Prunus yedoensis var. nudiflora TaxID=2094558 RepID=A0A314XS69_PRUYE|nr:hypothetical protein Pyn_14232 [Prunus yedoensis var. nudiflora]
MTSLWKFVSDKGKRHDRECTNDEIGSIIDDEAESIKQVHHLLSPVFSQLWRGESSQGPRYSHTPHNQFHAFCLDNISDFGDALGLLIVFQGEDGGERQWLGACILVEAPVSLRICLARSPQVIWIWGWLWSLLGCLWHLNGMSDPFSALTRSYKACGCEGTTARENGLVPSRVANLCGGLFLLEGLAGPDGR